jgi:hypothetical protein
MLVMMRNAKRRGLKENRIQRSGVGGVVASSHETDGQ